MNKEDKTITEAEQTAQITDYEDEVSAAMLGAMAENSNNKVHAYKASNKKATQINRVIQLIKLLSKFIDLRKISLAKILTVIKTVKMLLKK